MYVIRTKLKDNIFLKDLDVVVSWNDPDGVLIENERFERSKDAQIALKKNQIYIDRESGDYSEVPDKNVVETENDLGKIVNPYQFMTAYIENYNGTNEFAIAMFVDGNWEILDSDGVSAASIIQDSEHRFVTDLQILQWENQSSFDGDYTKLYNVPSFSTVATTGSYNDLNDKPTIPELPVLAPVATSGAYNDLYGKPTLSPVATSGNYNDLTNKPVIPSFAAVAVSGNYSDLNNKPVLAPIATTGNYSDLNNKPVLATVATTGSYNDLTNKPTIPTVSSAGISGNYSDLINKPTLATVATTGNYNDLINKPVIPTGMPSSFATVASTGSYYDLIDTPVYSAVAASGSYADLTNKPTIPTKTSQLTLDNVYTQTQVDAKIAASVGTGTGDMVKSVYDTNGNGIVDKAEVANSVDYANVINKPTLASVATSGSYTDLTNKPTIPTKTSDLTLDNVYTQTQVDTKVASAGDMKKSVYDTNGNGIVDKAEVANSVDYANVTNKPTIPTKSSDLTLDNVYTQAQVDAKVSAVSGGGSSIVKYEATGSTDGSVIITATGTGVSMVKSTNSVSLTVPTGVTLISVQCHFTATEVGSTNKVDIDYNSTGTNSYAAGDFNMPVVQVVNDVAGSRAYKSTAAINYNVNSHTCEVSGLLTSTAVWVKLSF